MICPDCGHDNIEGDDVCEACGQPLVEFDPSGSDLEQSISRHNVEVLCPKKPVTVEACIAVRQAIGLMVERRIGCLIVQENSRLAGIVTERDVLNKVSGDLQILDKPVSAIMTRSPTCITSEDSIAYALHTMDLGGYRHLPVVDEAGSPTGVISIRDILRFLCVRFAELRAGNG